jgi:eukaryotic translation initiation factor 2C
MAKNVDLPSAGWYAFRNVDVPTVLPPRPKPSSAGQAIKMGLNTFNVAGIKLKPVYQYDVMIGSGTERRGLIRKVWEIVGKKLGSPFIFDGVNLAWSQVKIDREFRMLVDVDKEEGRETRAGKSNEHRVVVRYTTTVAFDKLDAYLRGGVTFDQSLLAAINFLDHLLREWPSSQYTAIKRNFFQHGETRYDLGGGIEAFKGVYQTMRIVHGGTQIPARLSVILDVANGTFWSQGRLLNTAVVICNARDPGDLSNKLRSNPRQGEIFLKKLRKLHVVARHREGLVDHIVIDRFIFKSAKEVKFETPEGKQISVYDYYAQKYNHKLRFDLPLVKATRGRNTLYPMELLELETNTRYNFKLDERQTSNMIKFAVEPPPQRWRAIEHGLKMLNWQSDPFLKQHGLQIDARKTIVDARLLPAPSVKYGQGEAKPGTSGRWDLKGKKFLTPNPVPLKSWGVCVVAGRRGGKPDRSVIENFVKQFITVYQSHGGRVENKTPELVAGEGEDAGAWVTEVWNKTGMRNNMRPQILMFILPDKNAVAYGRIKRSCECRYGVVSQCVQFVHAQKAQPQVFTQSFSAFGTDADFRTSQYLSNVCMKFNAKLGGSTARATGPKSSGPTGLFTASPPMIIGADVSHAAPGSQMPSMAAMTMSLDKLATRFAAVVETNGYRTEMILTETIQKRFGHLAQQWMTIVNNGKIPSRVYYFRDGVSEGQYSQVLEQEISDLKALFKTFGKDECKFLVVVGSKRHHVRFFPPEQKFGDRNGNALPGTLVETGVTHPFENDFYMTAHVALKGTARPMHYHVLLNEVGISNEELQTLIYEHSYQYARATTPVSMFPAIYYAHIASNRGVCHDKNWNDSTSGQEDTSSNSAAQQALESRKCMEMPNPAGIQTSMWYI